MKKYQIADFIFGIHMEESLEIPENFKKFLIDTDEEVQVEYFLEVVDKLPVTILIPSNKATVKNTTGLNAMPPNRGTAQ